MKKQNGFSQIFVMVVMLILAIALPVTANLVKKVQDNRSSAAVSSCSSFGGACVGTLRNCTIEGGSVINGTTCASPNPVCCKVGNATVGACGTFSSSQYCVSGKWTGSDSGCTNIGGGCVASTGSNGGNCTLNGTTGTIKTGLCNSLDHYSGYRCCVPGSAPVPTSAPAVPVATGCGAARNQCDGNNLMHCDGTNWSLVTACVAGCDSSNNTCKDECTLGQAATCPSATTRQFCNKDADGGIRLKTETCANGCEGGNCKATPAPVGCGTSGTRRCDGKGTLQICNGTDWISQPVAAICEGNKAYNCDGNITTTNYADCTLLGQVCVTGHCVNPSVNGALGPANGTIVTTKPTSSGACSAGNVVWTDDNATDGTYNWTCAGTNGGTSVNGSANKADCTVNNQKCTTNNKYYTCADGLWAHSTTTTPCATGKVCTNGEIGTAVCKDPAYTAPKLNLYFAISGVKKINPCFGDLKFNVTVTKDGSNAVTSREVTATVVDNRFNTSLGDQVLKISDFALTNDYALTDKIKITIGSDRKVLATIYGKDSQNTGFPALNKSQILVSDLVNKTLSLADYPILNGDIGTNGSLGTQDKVVNGADFAFMKNEWGKTCKSGENLNADLNGDCRVDTFDLQILKNAMAEQYSQKTD